MARCSLFSTAGALLFGLSLLGATASRAGAADSEVREFVTKIDGKQAGECVMTIQSKNDGTISTTCQANIKITKLGITVYKYSYNGTEVWSDGRLQRLMSRTTEYQAPAKDKRYNVSATAGRDGLRMTVNGDERSARADVWVTSYWRLPDAKQRNAAVPLLDADTGKTMNGRLQYAGASEIDVAGRSQKCSHYRVTGDVTVDLWYDAQERLVRQAWVEDGHQALLELTGIRR
jgi:hypothetical protein